MLSPMSLRCFGRTTVEPVETPIAAYHVGRSAFSKSPLHHFEQVVDRWHQGGQVALVDAALGESRGKQLDEFGPAVHVARGERNRHLDTLLNDPNRPIAGRAVGLPRAVPAGCRAPLRDASARRNWDTAATPTTHDFLFWTSMSPWFGYMARWLILHRCSRSRLAETLSSQRYVYMRMPEVCGT